ncbi:MAG TPA: TRAP transporter large permease [Arenibaculum sp.]|nr:TRAP transporter large permease [Arenibaculum sp.]
MLIAILFGSFILALALGFPVALSLGISSMLYILAAGLPLVVLPQKMFAGMDSFVLLSIPGFILAGNLMNGGGITDRIIRFANVLVGHIRGGLGQANIAGSMLFGGISGTAVSDTASIGAVMIPGMKKAGYDAPFSAAVTAASSTVGPMIPPSVPMIIVGTLTGISVGQMFLAGAVPGILLGLGMMVTCYIVSRKRDYPRIPWQGFRQLGASFLDAIWAILTTFIILFGIVGGFFTPIEASVIAAAYAFAVCLFIYRGFRLRDVPKIIIDSGISSASIILLVGFANVFGYILTSERIPQVISAAVLSISDNPYVVILLLNVVLLIVGMFMETIAALIILVPPLLAVAQQVGIDPLHFATFAVLNLMLGLTTPPLGVCLFVAGNIGKVTMVDLVKAIWPFLLGNIVVLMLVSYIPALSQWLPGLFY